MRRAPHLVRLDAVAAVHRAPRTGAALCLAGLATAVLLGAAFRRDLEARERLDAELAALTARPRARPATPEALRAVAEAAAVDQELQRPWLGLLAELESASRDVSGRVAILDVEPDAAKRLVRITAEVRGLADALAYLKRLQGCSALRHPMLETHERRRGDPQRPLRITLSAEWNS